MEKQFIQKLQDLLKNNPSITLITHHNPDGDAIGSCLALYHFFSKLNLQVSVVVPNDFPNFYKWMPASNDIIIHKSCPEKAKQLLINAELIFCLDFNMPERVEYMKGVLDESKALKILIDHHQSPSDYFDLIYSETETSSTSELVYNVIRELDGECFIDLNIATCLYVGIITDTGSFSYNCDYPNTYSVTSELFKKGINGEEIHRLVYCTFSENRLRLLGHCLFNKMVIDNELKLAYIALSRDEMEKFSFSNGDTEGIVNYGLTIKNIKVSVLFSERKEYIKLSIRSTGTFNVGLLARKHFNGGGHKNASGANLKMSLDQAVNEFVNVLSQYKNEIFSQN